MAPLSWRHHTLLQALLSCRPLPEPDFHSLFAQISGGNNPATHQQLFNDILLKINKELAYLQFELRTCINQYDGMVYYGVVNNIADEESKLGSKYSVPQIAFYKGLLEAIAHEAGNDGSITNIEALNIRIDNQVVIADGSQDNLSRLPTSITNFSLSQKEKTLNELIRDRWLSYTSTGKIGLGIRSFLDLRSWFRSNDIPSCVVCNEAGIKVLGASIRAVPLQSPLPLAEESSPAPPSPPHPPLARPSSPSPVLPPLPPLHLCCLRCPLFPFAGVALAAPSSPSCHTPPPPSSPSRDASAAPSPDARGSGPDRWVAKGPRRPRTVQPRRRLGGGGRLGSHKWMHSSIAQHTGRHVPTSSLVVPVALSPRRFCVVCVS